MDQPIETTLLLLSHIIPILLAQLGLTTGISALLLGWIPMACGARGYSGKIYFAGITNIVLVLSTTNLVGNAQATNIETIHTLRTGLDAALLFISSILSIALAFTPAIIAGRERLPSSARIIGLNLGSIVLPILWIPALVVAAQSVRAKRAAAVVQLIRQQRDNAEPERNCGERAHLDDAQ